MAVKDLTAYPASRRGRPRDPERHRATLEATRDLLQDVGYDRVSIAEVARRAGVGRQLVYQWWGSKAALVQEAIFDRDPRAPRRYPGPFANDLRLLVTEMVEHVNRPDMRAGLPGLVAAMGNDPGLREKAEREFVAPLRARYERVVGAAIERGEVRPEVKADELLDTLRGAAIFHVQLHPRRKTSVLIDHLVALVLHGIATEGPRT